MKTLVIDFHSHLGNWGRYGMDDDMTSFLRVMDQGGIDRACLNCVFLGDARRANDRVAKWVEKHPDRFIGAAFVTPHYPDEIVPELERAFGTLGMKFIKIYPDYFGRPQDDPAYFPAWEWANERGLPVMCHATYPFDDRSVTVGKRYAALVQRFPRIRWVLAHAGGDGGAAAEAARDLPNLYLETCGSALSYGGIERSVAVAGADRVLFGSDMPLIDGIQQLARVATADIPDEAKRKILGLNAARLLGLKA
jgi:predicted TIM-barrel fold metal-dependent hydrolase